MSSLTPKSVQGYEMLDISDDNQSTTSRNDATTPLKNQSSEYNKLSNAQLPRSKGLHVEKRTWIWVLASHIVVNGILIAVIVLGAIGKTYHFNDAAAFLFFRLSIDNQMFFFGIFSKAADYVLNDSIARITGVLLTVWMSQPTRFPGVIPLDFELSEEMAKPWIAISHAISRWKRDPSKNKPAAILRVILSLVSGFAVLLLGGSINVLAMPKLRWVQEGTSRIAHINAAYADKFSSDMGNTMIASSIIQVLSNINDMYIGNDGLVGPQEYVFCSTIQRGNPVQYGAMFESPVLAIRGRGLTMGRPNATADVRTISIQEGPIYDFWTSSTTSEFGPRAIGARNWVNFTLPVSSTTCIAEQSTDTAFSAGVSVLSPTQFAIMIPANGSSSSIACSVSLSQVVHPIYIYNSTSDSRDDIHVPAMALRDLNLTALPFDDANKAIVKSLAIKFNTTIPRIELLTDTTFPLLAQLLASKLSESQNLPYPLAMSYVIGLTTQQPITVASWSESNNTLRHQIGPIQWQLYGSGPRLEWQWIIAVVVAFTFIVLLYDSYLLIIRQIQPGPWLSLTGMMMAANSTDQMRDPHHDPEEWRLGVVTEHMERKKIFMRTNKRGLPGLVLEDASLRWRDHHAGE